MAESTEVKIVGTPDKQCEFQVSVAGVKLCPRTVLVLLNVTVVRVAFRQVASGGESTYRF